MFYLNVMPVIRARQIESPHSFLVKAGISPHSAQLILHGGKKNVQLEHIEKLCRALFCEPNDLFLWIPDNNEQLPPNHPLYKLQEQVPIKDWKKAFATMPLQQLRNISIQ